MIDAAKCEYYREKIIKHGNDQKALFDIVDSLLDKKQESPLPSSNSDKELADKFANFFTDKIVNVNLSWRQHQNHVLLTPCLLNCLRIV
jgi:hypothetical protein